MAEGIGRISEPLTEFTCFEKLPLELQYRVMNEAYLSDLADCSGNVDVEIVQDQPKLVAIADNAYDAPNSLAPPTQLPGSAPQLFGLYAVNMQFKEEFDRLSGGRLTFAFRPDFKARKCLDVVYFDPSQDKLRFHHMTEAPDIINAGGILCKKILRDAKTVHVYCHLPLEEETPVNVTREFHRYWHSSSSTRPIWSGIACPSRWADAVASKFPNVIHTYVCWWAVWGANLTRSPSPCATPTMTTGHTLGG